MTREQHKTIKTTIRNIEETCQELEFETERLNIEWEKMSGYEQEENLDFDNLIQEMVQLAFDMKQGIINVSTRLDDVSGGLT